MAPKVGDIILERYELAEKLGQGGQAEVFRAVERRLSSLPEDIDQPGRSVAIKFIREDLLKHVPEETITENLRREIRILERISLPEVVTLHAVGLHNGLPFLVMEHVEGPTLEYPETDPFMQTKNLLDIWDPQVLPFIGLVDQLLVTLAALHNFTLVHMDIKPGNLLLQEFFGRTLPSVRLLDFGISRYTVTEPDQEKVQPGGSPLYMAPELSPSFSEVGHPADRVSDRCDQYSVGVLLYRGLSGAFPYPEPQTAGQATDLWAAKGAQPPLPIPPFVPAPLAAVVTRAIETEPRKRYPNDMAFRAALGKASDQVAEGTRHRKLVSILAPWADPEEKSTASINVNTCLVVLPDVEEATAACQEIIGPVVETVECPDIGASIHLETIAASSLLPGSIEDDAVQKLTVARVVIWITSGLQGELITLVDLLHRTGRVMLADLPGSGRQIPPELMGLPSLALDPDHVEISQNAVREAMEARLNWRWLPSALAYQWQTLPWAVGRLKQAYSKLMTRAFPGTIRDLSAICEETSNPLLAFQLATLRRDLLPDSQQKWEEMVDTLKKIVERIPQLAPAWRDLGVAYGRLGRFWEAYEAFETAMKHDPGDYDLLSSLGGFYKTCASKQESVAQQDAFKDMAISSYSLANEITDGHPYPLLNWYRMVAIKTGQWQRDEQVEASLAHARTVREAHLKAGIEMPWCVYDLIEICIYQGDTEAAQRVFDRGCSEGYLRPGDAFDAFMKSIRGLQESRLKLPDLSWIKV